MIDAGIIIQGLLAEDRELIPYRKSLRKIAGSVTSTILLSQILWRSKQKGDEPFYKFKSPCGHELYKTGDSWTEELGFSEKEFDSALENIATKVTKGDSKAEAYAGQTPAHIVIYWTDSNRVTWYHLNKGLLAKLLSGVYLVNSQREDTRKNPDRSLPFLSKETTDTTTENISPDQSSMPFLFSNGTGYNTLPRRSTAKGKALRSQAAHVVESTGIDLRARTAITDLIIDAYALRHAIDVGGDDRELRRMQEFADTLIKMGFETVEKVATLIENAKATMQKDIIFGNLLVQHASRCKAEADGVIKNEHSKPTTNHLDRRSQVKAASDADAEARFGHYNALLDEPFVPDPL